MEGRALNTPQSRLFQGEKMKICRQCGYEGPIEDFHKHKRFRNGRESLCKKCQSKRVGQSRKRHAERVRLYNLEYRNKNRDKVSTWNKNRPIEKRLLDGAKRRSKERNLPCLITIEDISVPECCPILGIKLERSPERCSGGSPSLDCIIPELGYVPGNVAVISFKANTIKNNASLQELEQVVQWLG